MNRTKLLYLSVMSVWIVAGCSEDLYVPGAGDSGEVITFQTAPLTEMRAAAASDKTLTSFTVSAWAHPAAGNYAKYVINGAPATRNEGGSTAWDYYPPAYFPATGQVDFFAYAPASSINVTTGLKAAGAAPSGTAGPSIVYKVPGFVNDSKTIDQQEDFLVSRRVNQTGGGAVNVNFKHALSRLVFKAQNIAEGKTFVIKKLSITNLHTTGTLAMDSVPDGDNKFTYPEDGTNYTTKWTNPSDPHQEYAVDLGVTQLHVPFSKSGAYTDITNPSNGLMVMPQATALGELADPTEDSGTIGELVAGKAPNQATYLCVTVAEVDRVTQAVTGERTLYFVVHDPYDTSKPKTKGITFEAGRQYSFMLTLANGYIRFGAPTVSAFDVPDFSVIYPFPCSTFTDARDQLVYKYCLFGDKYWMTENLAYKPSSFTYSKNNSTAPYYYRPGPNNNEISESDVSANASAYGNAKPGFLYNWAAAMNLANSGSQSAGDPANRQGICPDGWRIPTDAEWTALEKVMVSDAYKEYSTFAGTSTWDDSWAGTNGVWRGSTQGQRMKSMTIVPGGSATGGLSRPAGSGGFNGLLVGYAYGGSTHNWGTSAYFWSSTSSSGTYAWYRCLYTSNANVYRNAVAKYVLFSVRCVQ